MSLQPVPATCPLNCSNLLLSFQSTVPFWKVGSCPNVSYQGCSSNCASDSDCGGTDKCCDLGCGRLCVDRIPPGEKHKPLEAEGTCRVKVTVYVQWCFQLTRHNASGFHYGYSKHYIKLKLINFFLQQYVNNFAIAQNYEFSATPICEGLNHLFGARTTFF